MYWDIIVYDETHRPAVAVEVKSLRHKSAEWATQFGQNLMADDQAERPRFLLMILSDNLYLWQINPFNKTLIDPPYIADAQTVFAPYIKRLSFTLDQLSGSSLEMIVAAWLDNVIYTPATELPASQSWLVETGLHSAIYGGKVALGVAV